MIKLADFIAGEAGVRVENVMLLRHSQRAIDHLQSLGVTVRDYTIVQPTGTRYDYRDPRKPPIDIVVVLVDDWVNAVYQILGVKKEGTAYELNVPALTQDDKNTDKADRPAQRFRMRERQSAATGCAIIGWEKRQRTTVQRSSGAFFSEIEVALPEVVRFGDEVTNELENLVQKSLRDSTAERQGRLRDAAKLPTKIEVRSTAFIRNADVIAAVLLTAKGTCELCDKAAPFIRQSDRSPYLEVHHKVRLADGGEDTVQNALALCPNCHRHQHFG